MAVGNGKSSWVAWKNVMKVKKWREDGGKGLCRFEQFEVGAWTCSSSSSHFHFHLYVYKHEKLLSLQSLSPLFKKPKTTSDRASKLSNTGRRRAKERLITGGPMLIDMLFASYSTQPTLDPAYSTA
ncbi:Protein of unknown function [Pyronema omphalodes CBS 100304]|uniref:Uncharacterized protein n=1 Tax=Pyronema omphalodes (strain CBS 100304) TaxID=1076935 RepID=U4L0N3_PYROM|nr:Protein of unknown function [Pyronema omphalodes CBS 100304]